MAGTRVLIRILAAADERLGRRLGEEQHQELDDGSEALQGRSHRNGALVPFGMQRPLSTGEYAEAGGGVIANRVATAAAAVEAMA